MPDRKSAAVYFVIEGTIPKNPSSDGDWPIKIGFSATHGGVVGRVRALQTGNPRRLSLLRVLDADRPDDERQLHDALASWRAVGEWFVVPGPVVRLIKYRRLRSVQMFLEDLPRQWRGARVARLDAARTTAVGVLRSRRGELAAEAVAVRQQIHELHWAFEDLKQAEAVPIYQRAIEQAEAAALAHVRAAFAPFHGASGIKVPRLDEGG